MKLELDSLTKEELQKIIQDMAHFLSEGQYQRLQLLIEESKNAKTEEDQLSVQVRLTQELVDEKMRQFESWKQQIDDGDLYLNTEEYEDYSSGYWDPDWVTEYYDNQGIGDKIMFSVRFAKDCVDDRRYEEANIIYNWLWEMEVYTDSECGESADLEMLEENNIIRTDMNQLALLTLYTDYQVLEPEKRAEDIYRYFCYGTFAELHMEDMFHVGRESLENTEQFWKDWIALLKTKRGDTEGRLLKEAVLYCDGIEGLVQMAEENADAHPSLYLAAMKEYARAYAYGKIEEIGKKALEKIDETLVVRGEIAIKAAFASSCLQHEEEMMRFCWECFRSDSTDKNFLRLFGTEKMAERYGINGKEVLTKGIKGKQEYYGSDSEQRKNMINDNTYHTLRFYMGDFEAARAASVNPKGSLGWSGSFIRYGIRLILLYLYERPLPSNAAGSISAYVGFTENKDYGDLMDFERKIAEESRERKVSIFWNYFQRWKRYFPMEHSKKLMHLAWAEKIVYSRAEAIVSGQHRNQYREVAALLAVVGEIKEDMGEQGASKAIFMEYKKKFPRHSSFQKEMKEYFNEW